MPLYEYECPRGHRSEAVRPIAESALPRACPLCDEVAGRILSPTRVAPDYPGYTSPIDGRWIEGRRAHQEDLRRNGCRLWEPGDYETSLKRRAQAQEAAAERAAETVERVAGELGVTR